MFSKRLLLVLMAFCVVSFCRVTTLAQGGWDVWTVYLRDGDWMQAAPLWSLDDKGMKHGFPMEGGDPLKRSLIGLLSNNLRNSEYRLKQGTNFVKPEPPVGDFDKDLVVMDDGRRVFGTVIIRPGRDQSGRLNEFSPVVFQNGVETDLTRVAHIKLATPNGGSKKSRETSQRKE